MLILKNISKTMGTKMLFQHVNMKVRTGEIIGIVGNNGSGKSTFLQCLAGEMGFDTGTVEQKGERIVYIPQEIKETDLSVIEFCGGHKKELNLCFEKVGLESSLYEKPVMSLSGGQKTKLLFAKALLSHPTILLLDEPTNHLDADGRNWVLSYIASFRGTVFVVSHDRELLEHVTSIYEIGANTQSFDIYNGGWTYYKDESLRRKETHTKNYEIEQREKKRLEEYLKWRQAQASAHSTRAIGAQIRATKKRLEREFGEDEVKRPVEDARIHTPVLQADGIRSKLLTSFSSVSFVRDTNRILLDVSFEIRGRERVCIYGKNGAGKTTILKLITNEYAPTEGMVRCGQSISIGYFSQEHDTLDYSDTVMQAFLKTEARPPTVFESRQILASFLFTGTDLNKNIQDLSPGERVRLLFAKLTYEGHDFLLLDEPTNHLDIASKETIEKALRDFKGGLLVISHDTYFIKNIGIESALEIKNGRVKKVLL